MLSCLGAARPNRSAPIRHRTESPQCRLLARRELPLRLVSRRNPRPLLRKRLRRRVRKDKRPSRARSAATLRRKPCRSTHVGSFMNARLAALCCARRTATAACSARMAAYGVHPCKKTEAAAVRPSPCRPMDRHRYRFDLPPRTCQGEAERNRSPVICTVSAGRSGVKFRVKTADAPNIQRNILISLAY